MINNAETINLFVNDKFRSLAESDYKEFNRKIIPTDYEIIGVRMPALKQLAKEIATSSDVGIYLDSAEFVTYEHVMLYGLVLGSLKSHSLDEILRYFDMLIPKFDNWAHVDTVVSSLKVFKKHPEKILAHFLPLRDDEGEFTKRTFVVILMDFIMTEKHIDTAFEHLAKVPQGQYYVDMAIAWTISDGLIKFYDKTLPLLENMVFTKFVHNKAIQKARESYRISPEIKEQLNRLKIISGVRSR